MKKAGNPNSSKTEELPGPSDIGLTYKEIHEARQIREYATVAHISIAGTPSFVINRVDNI
ncbi:hypothetical protein F9K88_08175 [Brucella intermedia]|uniref:hypothetical protein n=1 Tax=Brucella intermedia TaxID=94625 RepID=UPI00124F3729|nr:hypothetical protein [Brucella intermedia]KAB2712921.1 hypothetical protein F9K88_08175 [Brucella intermedia]